MESVQQTHLIRGVTKLYPANSTLDVTKPGPANLIPDATKPVPADRNNSAMSTTISKQSLVIPGHKANPTTEIEGRQTLRPNPNSKEEEKIQPTHFKGPDPPKRNPRKKRKHPDLVEEEKREVIPDARPIGIEAKSTLRNKIESVDTPIQMNKEGYATFLDPITNWTFLNKIPNVDNKTGKIYYSTKELAKLFPIRKTNFKKIIRQTSNHPSQQNQISSEKPSIPEISSASSNAQVADLRSQRKNEVSDAKLSETNTVCFGNSLNLYCWLCEIKFSTFFELSTHLQFTHHNSLGQLWERCKSLFESLIPQSSLGNIILKKLSCKLKNSDLLVEENPLPFDNVIADGFLFLFQQCEGNGSNIIELWELVLNYRQFYNGWYTSHLHGYYQNQALYLQELYKIEAKIQEDRRFDPEKIKMLGDFIISKIKSYG